MEGERRGRRNYMSSLGFEVRKIAKPILGKKGFSDIDIIVNWEGIIGNKLSRNVKPLKLVFSKGKREGATLHVLVSGGAFATELIHNKQYVLERINTFFGYRAVNDIKIKQELFRNIVEEGRIKGKEEKEVELSEKFKEIIYAVEDEELQESLARLGKTIIGTSKEED